MTGTIYLYAFAKGRNYVGQSWDAEQRHKDHKSRCKLEKHVNAIFQNCYNLYGLPDPIILASGIETQSELDRLESLWTWRLSAHVSVGGICIKLPGSGGRLPDEIIKKRGIAISVANSGKNNPFYGKKHTAETKEKMSINNGMKRPEVVEKISAYHRGKKRTPETCKNIRQGKYVGKRQRAKAAGQLELF